MTETQNVNGKTVLLVEDSNTQALHFQALLEEQGLRVAWANTGEAGVQMAQQEHPDLILLDLQLPDMNGFEVFRRIRRVKGLPKAPVIMLTQHDESESVVLGLQIGITDYIPKDAFADAVLLETLQQMGVLAPDSSET